MPRDADQIDRDAMRDVRHERDHHREPSLHRHPRCVRPVARGLFQAAVIDSVNADHATDSVQLRCPLCRGPVFVPCDSHAEIVTCTNPECAADLVTSRRQPDGPTDLEPAPINHLTRSHP
jgi:hypothetical protein